MVFVFEQVLSSVDFSGWQLAFVLLAVFAAGLVRGFAGFGLSAVMMAGVVSLVPPVSLIPICFMLEAVASFAMFRGGLKNANMRVVWGLVIGSALGTPLGLYATNSMPIDLSKNVALILVLTLTASQMLGFKPSFLQSKYGPLACGLLAGIATGLASVGGMVVALYVLASGVAAKNMRGSLVMFLFLGMFSSGFYLWVYDMWTITAIKQTLSLTPMLLLGLLVGSLLFKPDHERFYKRACQWLLVVLCLLGLARQVWG